MSTYFSRHRNPDGTISPRRIMERTERQAHQALTETAVGHLLTRAATLPQRFPPLPLRLRGRLDRVLSTLVLIAIGAAASAWGFWALVMLHRLDR